MLVMKNVDLKGRVQALKEGHFMRKAEHGGRYRDGCLNFDEANRHATEKAFTCLGVLRMCWFSQGLLAVQS